jgi:hypothetical protein
MFKSVSLKKILFCLAFMMVVLTSASAQHHKSETFYFEGNIGSYAVHMTLTFHPNNTVKGFYTYDSQVAQGNNSTIPLEGTYSGDIHEGHIMLIEYNPTKSKAIGTFDCVIEGGYGHEGMFECHWLTITGYPGYRNYKSGKTFAVDLGWENTYRRY